MSRHFDISLISAGASPAETADYAEDLAWDAATAVANMQGIDLSSDEFVSLYATLRGRYSDCAFAFGHLHNTAAQTLQILMETGMAVTIPKDATEAEITLRFHKLVGVVLSFMMWCYTSGPEGWIPNTEWNSIPENERTTTFEVLTPITYQVDKQKENNDRD
jgi:hypothetical protein